MPLVLKAEPRVALELSAAEQRIYDAYRKAFAGIGDINDSKVLRAIEDAINANNPLGAVNAVAWGSFAANLQNTVEALNKEVIKAANDSARSLPASVRIAANFTTADPRAIAFAEQRAGKLIRQVSDESRKAVTETVMEALRMRIDRREMVSRISKVVGLDSRQARALTRFYEKALADGRVAGLDYEEALAKADRLGDKYKKRLIRQRAVRIARTETVAASNAGRYLSWMEAEAQGLLGSNSVKRWITAIDERTCPICQPLNNKEVPYKTNFPTGELMPPVHPNCRCSAVIIPAEVSFIPLQKAVVSSDPIAAMFKHGSHDQSKHNPHKGGRGSSGSGATRTFEAGQDEQIHAALKEDQGAYIDSLSEKQLKSVAGYQAEGTYEAVNGYLRGQSDKVTPEDKALIETFDGVIEGAGLQYNTTVYRGVSDTDGQFQELKVGDVIFEKGYSSTSPNPAVAEAFANSTVIQGKPVVLEIDVPFGQSALASDVASSKLFGYELIQEGPMGDSATEGLDDWLEIGGFTRLNEVTLPRGLTMQVVKVTDQENARYVKVKINK